MVGIARLGVDGTLDTEPLMVDLKEGHPVNLEPLIEAALVVRRHREAIPVGVTAMLLGMRVAVGKLCGNAAAEAFEARVNGDDYLAAG